MRRKANQTETVLRRLVKTPETAHQIYELAESLYLRSCNDSDGGAATGRMTVTEIERIGAYLREVENQDREMKKQFAAVATVSGEFHSPKIPGGF